MIRTPAKIIRHAPHLAAAPPLPNAGAPVIVQRKQIEMPPANWPELHRRALSHDGSDDSLWLMFFTARIASCGGCRQHWDAELKLVPPDFKNYFFWSVAIHNVVNARLGKPQISVDEARAIWSKPTDPPKAGPVGQLLGAAGAAMWGLLHRRAIHHKGGDDSFWLTAFSIPIPRSCCSEDWRSWCKAHPPRWDEYFAWTVEAHNGVNARLGKPIVTLEEARQLWSNPSPADPERPAPQAPA